MLSRRNFVAATGFAFLSSRLGLKEGRASELIQADSADRLAELMNRFTRVQINYSGSGIDRANRFQLDRVDAKGEVLFIIPASRAERLKRSSSRWELSKSKSLAPVVDHIDYLKTAELSTQGLVVTSTHNLIYLFS